MILTCRFLDYSASKNFVFKGLRGLLSLGDVSMFNLADANTFVAVVFLALVIGIVIGGAVMVYFSRKGS
jgi:hypothetical protein